LGSFYFAAARMIPSPRFATPGIVTGERPWIAVSPKIAPANPRAETAVFEKVHK
jgi:hypothetical protein